jgi:hypothetical protein
MNESEKIKVFISYATEDYEMAKRLYDDLKHEGVEPWLDREDLLPGQQSEKEIPKVIQNSNFFLTLLSSKSTSKRGFVQKEQKIAFDVFDNCPDDQIFIIPARLDNCDPPHIKRLGLYWVDLFPNDTAYKAGLKKIVEAVFEGGRSEKPPEIESYNILSELGKWKHVHHDVQDLLNSLNIPYELLTRCRYKPSIDTLEYASDKWDGVCMPKLKSVGKKISSPQYPDDDILREFKQEAVRLDDFTESLTKVDAGTREFRSLYFQFNEIKDTVFDLLSVADTKIMSLINSMQRTEQES